MQLTTRYHLILISVLLISLAVIGSLSYYILHRHAREEVIKQAAVLMEAALAIRKYTVTEIKPLLALQNKRNFLPQSVPSYAATKNFDALRETHTEYRYKEATLNPTNPRDRATDWETDIIQEFRNNSGSENLTLVRDTPLGAMLYYARPIKIKNEGCLTCHGVVEDAPQTMLDLYGNANGFGWKMDEVVGSQIVSVPLSLPVQRANETFYVLMSIVTSVFVILYLLLVFFFKKFINNQDMTPNRSFEYGSLAGNAANNEPISIRERASQGKYYPEPQPSSYRERIAPEKIAAYAEPVSQRERHSERPYTSRGESMSKIERISENRYASHDEPVPHRERISEKQQLDREYPLSEREHVSERRYVQQDNTNQLQTDNKFGGFDLTSSDSTTQALDPKLEADLVEVKAAIQGLSDTQDPPVLQDETAFEGFDIPRGYDVTQALDKVKKSGDITGYSMPFNPEGISEASDPRTILLEEMYKHGKAPSILDEEYDVDDVVTNLSEKEKETETDKT
jgi:protein-histidine pros-kinase